MRLAPPLAALLLGLALVATAPARPLDWQDHLEEGETFFLPAFREYQETRESLNCCGCEDKVRTWEDRLLRAATPASLHFAMAVRKALRAPAPDAFVFESYYYLALTRFHQKRPERALAVAEQAARIYADAIAAGRWVPTPEAMAPDMGSSWLHRAEPSRPPRRPLDAGLAYTRLRELFADMAKSWARDTALAPQARHAMEVDLELTERVHGLDHPDHGQALRRLGMWMLRNDYVAAEGLEPLHRSLDLLERLEGTSHPDVVMFRGELAGELMRWARPDQAASLYVSALDRLFTDAVPEEESFLRVVEDTVFHFCGESTLDQHERILGKALELSDEYYGDASDISKRLLERMTGCYSQLRDEARATPYELRLEHFAGDHAGEADAPAGADSLADDLGNFAVDDTVDF